MLSDQSAEALLTLTADGAVGADFAGHVSAAGIDLPLGVGGINPSENDSRVRWIRESDEHVGAEVYAARNAGLMQTFAQLVADGPAGDLAKARLTAQTDGPNARVEVEATTLSQAVYALAGAELRTLLDETGQSSFLQLLAETDLRMSYGVTNPFAGPTSGFVYRIASDVFPTACLWAGIVGWDTQSDNPAGCSLAAIPNGKHVDGRFTNFTGANRQFDNGRWIALGN